MKCTWTYHKRCKQPVSDVLVMHPEGKPENVESVPYCVEHAAYFSGKHSGWNVLSQQHIVTDDREAGVW